MYRSVVDVAPNPDFTLAVTFDDGEKRILDMRPYLDFGVFQTLRDYGQFRRVRVAFDTVEWEGGPDLDPEFVYAKSAASVPRDHAAGVAGP